ncbi:MAG: helix-turn-helix transcriptional regulator [Nitrospinae bacterium]|nr:helix-turn-helix transcriptional regulator [Nitrospinota bacterium]
MGKYNFEMIRKRRKELGMTQLELARKTDVTREHIIVLEKGRKLPRADLLGKLAKTLKVREDYFFL